MEDKLEKLGRDLKEIVSEQVGEELELYLDQIIEFITKLKYQTKGERQCSDCMQVKPLTEFFKDGKQYKGKCKPCYQIYMKPIKAKSLQRSKEVPLEPEELIAAETKPVRRDSIPDYSPDDMGYDPNWNKRARENNDRIAKKYA